MEKFWSTKISQPLADDVLIRGYPHSQIIRNLSYAEGVYITLRGELPTSGQKRMMDGLLNALLEAGFVTSVTAARFIAGGCALLVPSVAAGMLTASGARTINPQRSAEFIQSAYELMRKENLTKEETAKRVVENFRITGERFPGFGHPTYKDVDFRAAELRRIAEENGILGEHTQLLEAIHTEFLRVTGKEGICLNIDGMIAALMLDMGFKPIETTAIALLSVLPGIMAHAIEEIIETRAFKFFPSELTEYLGPSRRDLPREQKA